MKKKHTIFLDTSTIIGGGIDFLERTSKVANLFITDIVLQELDGLKNAEGDTGYKAREIYRQLAPATTKELYELPDRTELKRDDTLFEMTLPSGLVFYTIHRNKYKTKDINDSKIIEVANDYKGTLATIDIAQSVRAKSVGCEVWVVKNKEKQKKTRSFSSLLLGLSVFCLGLFELYFYEKPFIFSYVYLFIGSVIMLEGFIKYDRTTPLLRPSKNIDSSHNTHSISSSGSDSLYTDPSFMGASWSYYNND